MNYLCHHPEMVRGRLVFEPFAGAGPLGLTALMLGAKEVSFLDINPRAVSFARRNVERNGLDAARSRFHTGISQPSSWISRATCCSPILRSSRYR